MWGFSSHTQTSMEPSGEKRRRAPSEVMAAQLHNRQCVFPNKHQQDKKQPDGQAHLRKGSVRVLSLESIAKVRLCRHGNPYYFPALSVSLKDGRGVILNSSVFMSVPGFYAPPLVGHVVRERQPAMDVAAFLHVPYHEIKGGEVTFALYGANKQVSCMKNHSPAPPSLDREGRME